MSESKDETPSTCLPRKTLPYRFSPKNKDELKKAVREWCECEEKAYETYQSHNSDWDVSNVTDFTVMFYYEFIRLQI